MQRAPRGCRSAGPRLGSPGTESPGPARTGRRPASRQPATRSSPAARGAPGGPGPRRGAGGRGAGERLQGRPASPPSFHGTPGRRARASRRCSRPPGRPAPPSARSPAPRWAPARPLPASPSDPAHRREELGCRGLRRQERRPPSPRPLAQHAASAELLPRPFLPRHWAPEHGLRTCCAPAWTLLPVLPGWRVSVVEAPPSSRLWGVLRSTPLVLALGNLFPGLLARCSSCWPEPTRMSTP